VIKKQKLAIFEPNPSFYLTMLFQHINSQAISKTKFQKFKQTELCLMWSCALKDCCVVVIVIVWPNDLILINN
jgi:mannose/fructose/N-acetylgalactosamine-specific phosphotransferase system component IIC